MAVAQLWTVGFCLVCLPLHSAWLVEYDQKGFVSPLGHLPTQAIAELRSLVDKLEASGEVLSEQNNVTLNPHLRHQESRRPRCPPPGYRAFCKVS